MEIHVVFHMFGHSLMFKRFTVEKAGQQFKRLEMRSRQNVLPFSPVDGHTSYNHYPHKKQEI
jgi:hypothetical protein